MSRIKEGDWVKVEHKEGTPPGLANVGVVEILKPPYARVVLSCGHKRVRLVFTLDEVELASEQERP